MGNGTHRSKLMDAEESDHYGQFAYRSDVIPPQKNQVEESNWTGLDRSASLRLPWGNTREVVPPTFKVRARMVADLGTNTEYVIPAPPVSDPLVYQKGRHGNHEAPDFTRDNSPFWACLTTNRRALNIRAHQQRNTVKEASDV